MQREVNEDSLHTVNVEKSVFVDLLGKCRSQLSVIEQESHDYKIFSENYHKHLDVKVIQFQYTLDELERLFQAYKYSDWKLQRRRAIISDFEAAIKNEDHEKIDSLLQEYDDGIKQLIFDKNDAKLSEIAKQAKEFSEEKKRVLQNLLDVLSQIDFTTSSETEELEIQHLLHLYKITESLISALDLSTKYFSLASPYNEKGQTYLLLLQKLKLITDALEEGFRSKNVQQLESSIMDAKAEIQVRNKIIFMLQRAELLYELCTRQDRLRKRLLFLIETLDRKQLDSEFLVECEKEGEALAVEVKTAKDLLQKQYDALRESEKFIKQEKARQEICNYLENLKSTLPQYDLDDIYDKWKLVIREDFINSITLAVYNENEIQISEHVTLYHCNISEEVFSKTDLHLQSIVENAVAFTEKKRSALENLQQAIQTRDKISLIESIRIGKHYISLDTLRLEAEEILKQVQFREAILLALEEAIKNQNISELTNAIANAKASDISDIQKEIELAEAVLKKLVYEETVLNNLRIAIAEEEVSLLEAAIVLANEDFKPKFGPLVMKATSVLEHRIRELTIQQIINKAIFDLDRVILKSGILEEAKIFHRLEGDILRAKELLAKQDECIEKLCSYYGKKSKFEFMSYWHQSKQYLSHVDLDPIEVEWNRRRREIFIQECRICLSTENEEDAQVLLEDYRIGVEELIYERTDQNLLDIVEELRRLRTEKLELIELFKGLAALESCKYSAELFIEKSKRYHTLTMMREEVLKMLEIIYAIILSKETLLKAETARSIVGLQLAIEKAKEIPTTELTLPIERAMTVVAKLIQEQELRVCLQGYIDSKDRKNLQNGIIEKCEGFSEFLLDIAEQARNLLQLQQEAIANFEPFYQTDTIHAVVAYLDNQKSILPEYDLTYLLESWFSKFVPILISNLEICIQSENDEIVEELHVKYNAYYSNRGIEAFANCETLMNSALQMRLLKRTIQQKLQEAIIERNKKNLLVGMEESNTFQTLSNLRLEASFVLAELEEEENLVNQLQQAMRGSDIHVLKSAIHDAKLKEAKYKSLPPLIAQAEAIVERFYQIEEVRRRFRQIMEERDRKILLEGSIFTELASFGEVLEPEINQGKHLLHLQEEALKLKISATNQLKQAIVDEFLQTNMKILPDYELQLVQSEWRIYVRTTFLSRISQYITEEEDQLVTALLEEYEQRILDLVFSNDDPELNTAVELARAFLNRYHNAMVHLQQAIASEIRQEIETHIEISKEFKKLELLRMEGERVLMRLALQDSIIQELLEAIAKNEIEPLEEALAFAKEKMLSKTFPYIEQAEICLRRLLRIEMLRKKANRILDSKNQEELRSGIILECEEMGHVLSEEAQQLKELLRNQMIMISKLNDLEKKEDITTDDVREWADEAIQYFSAEDVDKLRKRIFDLIKKKKEEYLAKLNERLQEKPQQWEKIHYEKTQYEENKLDLEDMPEVGKIETATMDITIEVPDAPTKPVAEISLIPFQNAVEENKFTKELIEPKYFEPLPMPKASQLPSKVAGVQTHGLIEQLETYVTHIYKKGLKGDFEKNRVGQYSIQAMDKYCIVITRLLAALIADRTKSDLLIKERTPWQVFSKLKTMVGLTDEFLQLEVASSLRKEEDTFSLSVFFVAFLLIKGILRQSFDMLTKDDKYLTECYESNSIFRNLLLYDDLKYLMNYIERFEITYDLSVKENQQELVDELIAESIHAPPITQIKASVKLIIDIKSGGEVSFKVFSAIVRKRLSRALLILFMDGFRSFKLFGRYYVWDLFNRIVSGKFANGKVQYEEIGAVMKECQFEVESVQKRKTLDQPMDIMFILFVCRALQAKKLHYWLKSLLDDKDQIDSFYTADAILRKPQQRELALKHLEFLSYYEIDTEVDIENVSVKEMLE